MTLTFTVIFFVLGLIIGSFLNVVVYRLKDAETLLGRSVCRHCRHQIRWYDNIPVFSFLLLRGRCRDCRAEISWQYPAVELMTGISFVLMGVYFFSFEDTASWVETAWLLSVVSCCIVVAAYDIRHMEIPLIPLAIIALLTILFFAYELRFGGSFFWSRLWLGIAGAAVVGGFFFALVYASHETWMGWGDVWLGCLAGLVVGLPAVLFMLTVSFASGSAVGIAGMYAQGKGLKSQMPFGPFLVIGMIVTILFPELFPGYASLFMLSASGWMPLFG